MTSREEIIDNSRNYWQTLLVGQYPQGPLGGLALTILMAVVCVAVPLPLALVLALCRTSTYRVLRWSAFAVIQFVRGLPLIVFIESTKYTQHWISCDRNTRVHLPVELDAAYRAAVAPPISDQAGRFVQRAPTRNNHL